MPTPDSSGDPGRLPPPTRGLSGLTFGCESGLENDLGSKLCRPLRDLRALLMSARLPKFHAFAVNAEIKAPAKHELLDVPAVGAPVFFLEPLAQFATKIHGASVSLGGSAVLQVISPKGETDRHEATHKGAAGVSRAGDPPGQRGRGLEALLPPPA